MLREPNRLPRFRCSSGATTKWQNAGCNSLPIKSMEIRRNQWMSTYVNGYPWIPMHIHCHAWVSMDIHGYTMDIHCYPWVSVIFIAIQWYPLLSMNVNWYQCICIDFHWHSWMSIDIHWYPWTTMNIIGYLLIYNNIVKHSLKFIHVEHSSMFLDTCPSDIHGYILRFIDTIHGYLTHAHRSVSVYPWTTDIQYISMDIHSIDS